MLRVVIADDEPLALDLLEEMLTGYSSVKIVARAKSGREAQTAIRELRPDLVFLDIEMPRMSGFQVVQGLQADDHMPLVVFVTAFDQYAVEAFEVNAVDYVLKPVERSRLFRAIERARERHLDGTKGRLLRAMTAAQTIGAGAGDLAEQLPAGDIAALDRLPVRLADSVQLVPFDAIDWVDAAGDYMCVHANGETHILRCTMKQLSDRLAMGTFTRIHRSTLVNLSKIRSITPLAKGECLVHLDGDIKLKVSRNFRAGIAHLLP